MACALIGATLGLTLLSGPQKPALQAETATPSTAE